MGALNSAEAEQATMGQVEIGGKALQLRDLSPLDRENFLALHRRVFGSDAGDAWYEWKYAGGGGLGTGLWHDGQMVAHCGGVPRRLWLAGRIRRGIQIGDVMVAPEWRGILTRQGPLFHVSRQFYSAHVGEHAGADIAFGFPSERHLRLAVVLELLWDGGPIHALSWQPQSTPQHLPGWFWHWIELHAADPAFDAQVNSAWDKMRAAAGDLCLGERRADYVRWRYCERPGRRAHFFALRRPWSSAPAGIAVLDLGSPDAQWLDWIGDPACIDAASRACLAEAGRRGARSMQAWTSPVVTQSLSGFAAQSVTAWLGIPRASSLPAGGVAGMRWWLMGGDTDFL
jgi:hypothetical protein